MVEDVVKKFGGLAVGLRGGVKFLLPYHFRSFSPIWGGGEAPLGDFPWVILGHLGTFPSWEASAGGAAMSQIL